MTPPSKPPFQFSLASVFGLMAVAGAIVWLRPFYLEAVVLLILAVAVAVVAAGLIGTIFAVYRIGCWLQSKKP